MSQYGINIFIKIFVFYNLITFISITMNQISVFTKSFTAFFSSTANTFMRTINELNFRYAHVLSAILLGLNIVLSSTEVFAQTQHAPQAIGKTNSDNPNDVVWNLLEKSYWILDGSDKAPRIVYAFTDPNCPFCNKFWTDARPWVDSGKVQVRHVLVGILTPTSPGKAAALLLSKNPSATLTAHERGHSAITAKAFATGEVRMLSDEFLKPLSHIPPAIQRKLDENADLMMRMNLQGTPGVVWQDKNGAIRANVGAPQSQRLREILGS